MVSLSSIVRNVMTIDPSAPALEYEKTWTSWAELNGIIDAIELLLKENDIGPGARIGGILRNNPLMAAVIIGTIINDRCIVTLNPMLPDAKLANDIMTLKTPVIIAGSADFQRPEIREAARLSGALCLEVTGNPINPVQKIFDKTGSDFITDANGIGIEMLTSGTTGVPKRIPLPAANFSKMVLDAAVFENRDLSAEPKLSRAVTIANTPFAHIGGIFGLFLTLSAGRKACLIERFRLDEFVDAIKRHQPRVVSAPPSVLRMILDAKVPKEALSSLAVFRTSMAPLDPGMADLFYETYGVPILQNYGATEFAGGVAGWTLPDFKKYAAERRGSVGRMNPGIDGRIVDTETGAPLPLGEKGVLELRAKHLGDGKSWIRTTDLARMDDLNFLWILGRADNAIIRGGFKIIPDDVVKAIESHPDVLEACVVALPDVRLGQVPAAGYRVRTGHSLSEPDLRAYLREKLTAYQVPTKLLEVEEFARTPSHKPSQPELKKILEAA
ncbi:class I adenylate-forming enzyme family protein [Sphingorhabdus sp.]|uniref:class I adenylate-forming enzyme family protein n=1 Tax=Sphingorhabdus sp. TaxID=1902408 RepID=UPI0037C8AA9E